MFHWREIRIEQCPDEMIFLMKDWNARTLESLLVKVMCCLAALAAEHATMCACEGAEDAAPQFSLRGLQHHFVFS